MSRETETENETGMSKIRERNMSNIREKIPTWILDRDDYTLMIRESEGYWMREYGNYYISRTGAFEDFIPFDVLNALEKSGVTVDGVKYMNGELRIEIWD